MGEGCFLRAFSSSPALSGLSFLSNLEDGFFTFSGLGTLADLSFPEEDDDENALNGDEDDEEDE